MAQDLFRDTGELASLLSRRYVELPIQPLTFGEYRSFRSPQGANVDLFPEFLRFGGFPGLHRVAYEEETIFQYLSALTDSVLLKAVVMRNAVRDVGPRHALLGYRDSDIGALRENTVLADEATREREFRPLRTLRGNHPRYVLSMDRLPPSNDEGIRRIYLPDFLEGDW